LIKRLNDYLGVLKLIRDFIDKLGTSNAAATARQALLALNTKMTAADYNPANAADDKRTYDNIVAVYLRDAPAEEAAKKQEAARRAQEQEAANRSQQLLQTKTKLVTATGPIDTEDDTRIFKIDAAEPNSVEFKDIASGGFTWIANSCWADAALMALFKIPGLWLERRIRASTVIRLYGGTCTAQDAANMKNSLLADINLLHGSSRAASKSRLAWQNCVRNPVVCGGPSSSDIIRDDLMYMFKLSGTELTFAQVADNGNTQPLYNNNSRLIWVSLDPSQQLSPPDPKLFQLLAVIYGGAPRRERQADDEKIEEAKLLAEDNAFHYTAAVRNPITGNWVYENVLTTIVRLEVDGVDIVFTTDVDLEEFRSYRGQSPYYVIYYRKDDIERVLLTQTPEEEEVRALRDLILDVDYTLVSFDWNIERYTHYQKARLTDDPNERRIAAARSAVAHMPEPPLLNTHRAALAKMIPDYKAEIVQNDRVLGGLVAAYLQSSEVGDSPENNAWHDLRIQLQRTTAEPWRRITVL
jgi:hypothetical protein